MDPVTLNIIFAGVVSLVVVGISLIGAVSAIVIAQRSSRSAAKKSEMETLQDGHRRLEESYNREIDRLNKAHTACQGLIVGLQSQVTALTLRFPDPSKPLDVVVVNEKVPVELKHPIPLQVVPLAKAVEQLEQAAEKIVTATEIVADNV